MQGKNLTQFISTSKELLIMNLVEKNQQVPFGEKRFSIWANVQFSCTCSRQFRRIEVVYEGLFELFALFYNFGAARIQGKKVDDVFMKTHPQLGKCRLIPFLKKPNRYLGQKVNLEKYR